MSNTNQVTIIGIGNLLLQDEGIGVHVARALQKTALPHGVDVIDGGTSPEIYSYIESTKKLIAIDAMETGGIPGSVYRIPIEDLTTDMPGLTSIHEVNLVSMLKTMMLLGRGPREAIIIGVQPKNMDLGTELSPELQEKIPQIVQVVLKEVKTREPVPEETACS